MQRRQLFELNERPECPRFIRDSVVESLGTGLRWMNLGAVVGPAFADLQRRTRVDRVLDLCSGSGIPTALLADWLRHSGGDCPTFVVSDLLADRTALRELAASSDGTIVAARAPIDATAVATDEEHDTRTIINSFHHFAPAVARAILGDAVSGRKTVFIYEGFPRSLPRLAPTSPATLPALLVNPLLARRDRWLKGLFTYVVPVIPAAAGWDALVSVLRVYDESELMELVAPLADDYRWEYRELPYGLGGRAVVFSGIPEERLA